ncbi:hypothetical protein SAMN02745202_01225 [Segatella oulorum]|jgi:hypothetical protein|uniref:Uncharacterized protein n=2 Tax=Bacteroidales TaxID=171549 RepID=A0A1T4NYE3_9BACT|nr:hypothetical protein SAMN02745202_01225 [Segatella oulorum]
METAKIQFVTPMWNIEKMTGYKPLTTFWSDFSTAEQFGIEAVKGTFKRAFEEWKGDYKFLTELVMVLNHKIWQWYEKNDELARVYNALWEEADNYGCENLKGGELDYFYETLD